MEDAPESWPSLAATGLETMRLFNQVEAISKPVVVKDADQEELPKALFATEADRFELWAVNMGLFVSGHGSLDYRVREAESLAHTLKRFMSDLNNSLAEVLAYCAGESDQLSTQVGDDQAGGILDLKSLDEEMGDESDQEPDSDMDLLLDSVRDPIDRLYKLATRIRNPSSRFGSSKALHHQQIDPESNIDLLQAFEKFDFDYVTSLFSEHQKSKAHKESSTVKRPEDKDECFDADILREPSSTLLSQHGNDLSKGTESYLAQRIAGANVRRRQQFAYWKKHRDKLVQHARTHTRDIRVHKEATPVAVGVERRATEPSVAIMAPAQSVTTASRLNIPRLTGRDDQSTLAVTEYAPSTWQPSNEAVEFPPAPKQQAGQNFFECPYCFTLCSTALLREKAWKAHLIHDLRPYICTYEDCRCPDQLYDTRQDWIQHENSAHRRLWRCQGHPGQTFLNLEGYEAHLRNEHLDDSKDTPANLIDHGGEHTLLSPDRPCPVCSLHLETMRALQSHIALHLERLSLFSMPRSVDKDDEEAAEVDSDKANITFDGSRQGDFEEEDDDDQTLLWHAIENGYDATVELLLSTGRVNSDSKDFSGRTPLSRSASSGNEATAKLLLENGADPNSKDHSSLTPLSWSASNGNETITRLLLEKGADLDSEDLDGRTPLSWSASNGNEGTARLLLEKGAKPDSKDFRARTPLSWSASRGHEATARLLLEKAADLDSKDIDGWTPLSWATENGHTTVVKLLQDRRRYKEADELSRRALSGSESLLEQEHPELPMSMADPTSTNRIQGKSTEAEGLLKRGTEELKRSEGSYHLDTLEIYIDQYPVEETEKLLAQVVETRERVLGPDHPDTLKAISDLALVYSRQGKLKEAENLSILVLGTEKKVLGDEHPRTLTTMSNLAEIYRRQGNLDEVAKPSIDELRIEKKVLEDEHPNPLTSMNNLASTYRNQGRWTEAEEIQVQVLETRQKVLGDEHPDTLTTMSNLISIYSQQGRSKEAEKLLIQVLETKKRVLGAEHISTLKTMENLALIYRDQGRYAETEKLLIKTLELQKRVLGSEHFRTLVTMKDLASIYQDQRRYAEAEELLIETLELQNRVLGSEHISTIGSMKNLALIYRDRGRYAEAEELLIKTLELQNRVLRSEDFRTLATMEDLALLRKSGGRDSAALQLLNECFLLSKQELGADDPDTIRVRDLLSGWEAAGSTESS